MNYNNLNIEDFEKVLVKEFPEMYSNMYGDVMKTCLHYGLETPTGWNNLIYNLSRSIYKYCKESKIDFPIVGQVKEKFYGLRFYLDMSTCKQVDMMISEAEHTSYSLCFKCGFYFVKTNYDVYCNDCKKKSK